MRKLRGWRGLVVGALLLGTCIAFFAITSAQDSHLLATGTRTTATVVAHRGRGWNPLENGRVVVTYETPTGVLTRQIWLDDSADAPSGPTWTVVYDPRHPGRVRSLTDGNDPYPWAPPMLLSGLAGIIVMGGGLFTLSRFAGDPAQLSVPQGGVRVPLRHYRFFTRRPWIDVDSQMLRIRLPGVFGGGRTFDVPNDHVCLIARDVSIHDDSGEGWIFSDGIRVPYVPTTTPNVPPNLAMFFTTPMRVPPVTQLGAISGYLPGKQSRSADGFYIDGIELRAVDPSSAFNVLTQMGIASTDRPNAWMRARRTVSQDPDQVHAANTHARRQSWVSRYVLVGAVAIAALRFVHTPVAAGIAVALAASMGLLLFWARRKGRKADRTE